MGNNTALATGADAKSFIIAGSSTVTMKSSSTNDLTLFFVIFLFLMFFICGAFHTSYVSTFGALAMWCVGVFFAIKRIKYRFTMFSFYLGYFTFLLSGYFFYYVKTKTFDYFPNFENAITHTCYCLFLSIGVITIVCIYFYSRMPTSTDESFSPTKKTEISKVAFQLLITILAWSFICKLIVEILKTIYLTSTTYANVSYVELNLPGIIQYPAAWFYISLFMFWGTFPRKKNVYISLVLLLIIQIVIIISGERGEPISALFPALYYFLLREKIGIKDFTIQKRYIVLAVLILPVFVAYLQVLSETRFKREYDLKESNVYFDFFESQGVSAKVIANGYELKENISQMGGNTFILGEIRNYLKTNIFTRIFTGSTYAKDKYALADSGDLYSYTYGVLWSPITFEKGLGSGTTYIAEAYHDGGYLLLTIISILYPLLFYVLDKFKPENSFILISISLNILRHIVLLPRNYSLAWLTNTFAFQNIFLFILLYILCKKQTDHENNSFDERLSIKD